MKESTNTPKGLVLQRRTDLLNYTPDLIEARPGYFDSWGGSLDAPVYRLHFPEGSAIDGQKHIHDYTWETVALNLYDIHGYME